MKRQKIALFGDVQTLPYVRDTLALDGSLAPRIIDPAALLSSSVGLLASNVAYGVMASAMPRFFGRARLLGCRTVNHWIGTDVAQSLEDPRLHEQLRTHARSIDIHLCVAPWLQQELAELGIAAHLVPIVPSDLAPDPLPLPARHGVLAYTNEGREAFYGIPGFVALAREFPAADFYLCGTSRVPGDAPENLQVLGRLGRTQMRALYEKISVLYRRPEHDGLSKMVLEALSHGRQVLWIHEMEGVRTARDGNSARQALGEILSASPRPNEAGLFAIAETCNPARIARRTAGILRGEE